MSLLFSFADQFFYFKNLMQIKDRFIKIKKLIDKKIQQDF
jgi:hypothetical protein